MILRGKDGRPRLDQTINDADFLRMSRVGIRWGVSDGLVVVGHTVGIHGKGRTLAQALDDLPAYTLDGDR